jgi:hypothetical protein
MLIPATTEHDLFLCSLLERQVDDFEMKVPLEDVLTLMDQADRNVCEGDSSVPRSAYRTIKFLERHELIDFWPDNPHVRLTPSGVYTALLFQPQYSNATASR